MSTSTTTTITSSTGSLSNECCRPGPDINHEPKGKDEVFATGIKGYMVGEGKSLIVISTDIFGHEYVHLRQNADYLASQGFTVIVPDIFDGNAVKHEQFNGDNMSWLWNTWLPANPVQNATDRIRTVVANIRSKYKHVHGIGFCYGAKPIWELAAEGHFSSIVLCHPSFLQSEDTGKYAVPTLFNLADNDTMFTPELVKHYQTVLQGKHVRFIQYANTDHGFVARGGEEVQNQRKEALLQSANWFKQHDA